jgi:TolA-binding protein
MDAVTYPNAKVAEFINKNMIAVRVPADAKPLSVDFNVNWTPTLITLGPDGREHHRTLGFLAPEELIPSLMLGMAKVHFDSGRFEEALAGLAALLAEYPKSDAAPEAIYLRGVNRYKNTHDAKPLKEAYEQLLAEHASSEWTKRAYPYRLL